MVHAVVTGANSGIGFETARGLVQRGVTVTMGCRSLERGDTAKQALLHEMPSADVQVRELDLADKASIERFAKKVGDLEVLVNNAGVIPKARRETVEGMEETFAINHVGPFRLTHALLPKLRSATSPRIVTVASAAHLMARPRFEDLQMERKFVPWLQYCNSKLYNLWFSDRLAERTRTDGIAVHALHPGSGASDLWREFPRPLQAGIHGLMKSTERLAQTSIAVATEPQYGAQTGGYWHEGRPARRNRKSRDAAQAERLWQITEDLA